MEIFLWSLGGASSALPVKNPYQITMQTGGENTFPVFLSLFGQLHTPPAFPPLKMIRSCGNVEEKSETPTPAAHSRQFIQCLWLLCIILNETNKKISMALSIP